MKKIACRYAIIQFMPYTETGEFANVGVVLACPETGYFDFKLEKKCYARITAFFQLNRKVYLNAIKEIEGELARIQHLVINLPEGAQRASRIRELLEVLTHPREAMVRFSQPRPVLTNDSVKELEILFEYIYFPRPDIRTETLSNI